MHARRDDLGWMVTFPVLARSRIKGDTAWTCKDCGRNALQLKKAIEDRLGMALTEEETDLAWDGYVTGEGTRHMVPGCGGCQRVTICFSKDEGGMSENLSPPRILSDHDLM